MFNSFQNASVPNVGRSSNCNRVTTKIPQTPFLNSEVTRLMFIKLLHNVAKWSPYDFLKPLNDRPILFRTLEQRVKAVSFNFCKSPRLNWLSWQRSLGYRKTYISFVIHINVTTYAESLIKIGLVVVEIFGVICWFCRLIQKGAVVTSGVAGLILIVFAHDVATILSLNIFESELPNEGHFYVLPKIGCHGNVP